ncbi:MAG: trypsin-like peptidase domain-containing protein [Candidatus Nanopelagicales bacterium]
MIDPGGTILTNAHVVQPDRSCVYDRLEIGVTGSVMEPPVARYVASVHAFDADLDLAVLRVATGIDGPVAERLPFVEVG